MLERRENIILKKSEAFGDRIVRMYRYLLNKREGNIDILKQVLRSGTSIGANLPLKRLMRRNSGLIVFMPVAI